MSRLGAHSNLSVLLVFSDTSMVEIHTSTAKIHLKTTPHTLIYPDF